MTRTTLNGMSLLLLLHIINLSLYLCLAEEAEREKTPGITRDNSTFFSNINTMESRPDNSEPTPIKLKLLLVLPLDPLYEEDPINREVSRWDRGLEILPGAQLAVEAINKDKHLLPGYELEIVNKSVDPCIPLGVQTNLDAFVPFAKGVLDDNIVGMLGLFCYELLRSLSPLAGREEYGLFQLSGTISPHVRGNRQRYTHLNFAVPSEAAFYETVFTLMSELEEWTNLLVIDDSFFDLSRVWNSTQLVQNDLNVSFLEFDRQSSTMISEIRRSKNNVVFVSLGAKDTADLLCEAHDNGLLWPYYVWIVQDHEINDLAYYAHGSCTTKKLTEALQNTTLLRYQYEQVDTLRKLVTGTTYDEYLQQYTKVLNESGGNLKYNQYASVMHDSVWAFALALNQSLDTIARCNMTVIDFMKEFGREQLTNTIEANLQTLSFEGVGGHVQFNGDYDVDALVDVTLAGSSGTYTSIGYYNQSLRSLVVTLNKTLPSPDPFPRDYNLIPLPITVLLIVLVILCFILTTIMFILFIKYRRYSEIKAASPYLSMLMFAGTYLIMLSTLMQAILTAIVSPAGSTDSNILCGSVIAGNVVGISLIFSTLLLRMLRIYRIFSYFGKTGKIWSDKVLAVIVLLVIGGDVVLLVVWFTVDPFTVKEHIVYRFTDNDRVPYYEVSQYCSSDTIDLWFSLTFGKMAVLFVVVVFLAIKTRRIQKANFKDTKKVNIYIFLTVMIIATLIPVWFLLKETRNEIVMGIVIYLSFGSVGLLNQLMLFSPKVIPPMLRSMGFKVGHSARSAYHRSTIIRREFPNHSAVTQQQSIQQLPCYLQQ